jgi:hypothetical protein
VHATGEAVKRENKALQNMKFLPFFIFVGRFSLLDPDPHSQCGSGSSQPKYESKEVEGTEKMAAKINAPFIQGRKQRENKTFPGRPQNFHDIDLGMFVGRWKQAEGVGNIRVEECMCTLQSERWRI